MYEEEESSVKTGERQVSVQWAVAASGLKCLDSCLETIVSMR